MTPEHRYMVAFLAASLKTGKVHTRVYDHDAKRDVAVGGVVRAEGVDVIDAGGTRFNGRPELLFNHANRQHIRLELEEDGFGGFDYASERHFKGVFADGGAVQVYDHETERYHDFHVS